MRSYSDSAQATVEAAVFIPVALLLLLILTQPAILLYVRMVMNSAATQALRVLVTRSAEASDLTYKNMIEFQLSAVPDVGVFHEGSWEIELVGNELSSEVSVSISTKVEPLPLVGTGAQLLGLLGSDGMFSIEVEASCSTQADWVWEQDSASPEHWVSQWG